MASSYTLISSNVLASSAASVTFSSIPSTHTDLLLRISAQGTNASIIAQAIIRFNSDTASNYSNTVLYGSGTSAASGRDTSQTNFAGYVMTGGTNANMPGSTEIYIPSYTASQNKPFSIIAAQENNATEAYMWNFAGLWRNTAAIASISFVPNGAFSFASGSSFYLYGIKNS